MSIHQTASLCPVVYDQLGNINTDIIGMATINHNIGVEGEVTHCHGSLSLKEAMRELCLCFIKLNQ